MPLVEAIVHDDAFVSDDAVRAKYRTPVEKLVGDHAGDRDRHRDPGRRRGRARRGRTRGSLVDALRTMSYLPFLPPNVGGFPKGARLIGPRNLVHSFDLLQSVVAPPTKRQSVDDVFASLGVFDVSDAIARSRRRSSTTRRRLALSSPHRSTRSYRQSTTLT